MKQIILAVTAAMMMSGCAHAMDVKTKDLKGKCYIHFISPSNLISWRHEPPERCDVVRAFIDKMEREDGPNSNRLAWVTDATKDTHVVPEEVLDRLKAYLVK